MKPRKFIELDISIFLEGLICEYVKYCCGLTTFTLDDLMLIQKSGIKNLTKSAVFNFSQQKNKNLSVKWMDFYLH